MIKLFFSVIICLISFSVYGVEDDDELTDMSEPKKCLSLHAINTMKVIDENNILFYVRGQKLYQNTLPRKCSGLRPGSVISYEVYMGRLCSNDLISVMDKFGDRFSPSNKCSIGKFEQIPYFEKIPEKD